MNILCPKCQNLMVIMDRQGIHIDYCTQCHGVYLDRGEMEKIIELSVRGAMSTPPPQQHYQQPQYQQAPQPQYSQPQTVVIRDRDYDSDYYRHHRKKKKGWLDDIFDFD